VKGLHTARFPKRKTSRGREATAARLTSLHDAIFRAGSGVAGGTSSFLVASTGAGVCRVSTSAAAGFLSPHDERSMWLAPAHCASLGSSVPSALGAATVRSHAR
jgi:hypothetical protein